MLAYILPMLLCVLLHFTKLDKKNIKIAFWAIVSYLFVISAIRYDVGKDYLHWVEVYEWIENGLSAGNYVELGYRYLNKLIINIPFLNVYWLFGITSAMIIFPFGYYIKKHVKEEYLFLSLFLFIGTGVFFASLNLVRQYVAIVILMLGFDYLENNQYIKFLIVIVVASLFHTSAFIMIPFMILYILFKDKSTNNIYNKILICLYIFSLIFIFIDLRQLLNIFSFLLPERWVWYLESDYLNSRNYSSVVKQLVPNLILVFLYLNRNKFADNKNAYLHYLLLFVNVILTNCFYGIMVLVRLSNYFDISLIFVLPVICEIIKDNKNLSRLGYLSIIGYYTLLTIVTIFLMNGHGVIPYNTIFSLI